MDITTRLSEKAIQRMKSIKEGEVFKFTLQVLDMKESTNSTVLIKLSDGFFFADVYTFGDKTSRA